MTPAFSRDDALFALQLAIAQRADELARQRSGGTTYSLINWLEAEWEIFLRHGRDSAATDASAPSDLSAAA